MTFRLDDALPVAVVREIEYERQSWLRHRGIDPDRPMWKTAFSKLALAEQRIYERLLATKMNEQLDVGYGSCVLRRDEIARIVATVLDCFHDQRVSTGDYVIMPNHVHVLLRPLLARIIH